MRRFILPLAFVLAATLSSQRCVAKESPTAEKVVSATSLHFLNDIMASKPNDPRLYVLLGSGFLRPFTVENADGFVPKWIKNHPRAVSTAISRMISTNTITHHQQEIVYIWIEDGDDSLNVDLVRAGIFQGSTMYDMVDNLKGMDKMLKSDPKLADTWAQIRKERASAPQDRTDRLIPDSNYEARMLRIDNAERYARSKKLGIWSNTMKDEREAEGIQ
jgi:hypothetical protein